MRQFLLDLALGYYGFFAGTIFGIIACQIWSIKGKVLRLKRWARMKPDNLVAECPACGGDYSWFYDDEDGYIAQCNSYVGHDFCPEKKYEAANLKFFSKPHPITGPWT